MAHTFCYIRAEVKLALMADDVLGVFSRRRIYTLYRWLSFFFSRLDIRAIRVGVVCSIGWRARGVRKQ